ncbi:MAG: GlsB/YeaQ/YmgE family stress response membrane protein [Limisphaerales bacterium]
MNLALTILIGMGVGAAVILILPGHHLAELVQAMLLGIAGALLARFIGERAGWFGTQEPDSFLASALGAIVILALYRLLVRGVFRRR